MENEITKSAINDAIIIEEIMTQPGNRSQLDALLSEIIHEESLVEIARSSSTPRWVRVAAMRRVADESALVEVALSTNDWELLTGAIKQIKTDAFIIEISLKKKEYNKYLHDRLKDIAEREVDGLTLNNYAKTADGATMRAFSVERITNESVLCDVAKTDSDKNVRICAVKRIRNQTVLGDIAKADPYIDVRSHAVMLITEQSVLSEIAKSNNMHAIRKSAVDRLNNQSDLIMIAKNDDYLVVRAAAIDRILDKDTIADIKKIALPFKSVCREKGHDERIAGMGHDNALYSCDRCGYSYIREDDGREYLFHEGPDHL